MSWYFGTSPLTYRSIEELGETKDTLQKVIEYLRTASYQGVAWLGYSSSYDGIRMLEGEIRKIDEEMERRKSGILLLENGSRLLLEDGSSHLQLETPMAERSSTVQQMNRDTIKEQLVSKDKKIAILQREIEGITNELEHEKTHSDNQHRIIRWLSGLNGDFYTNDVDEDEQ